MTLLFIDQDKLSVSKTNMRYSKKASVDSGSRK